MEIQNDKVVSFLYTIRDESQLPVESNRDSMPMAFLCGKNNILKALEDQMLGRAVGDQFSVTLTPEQAYGEKKQNAQQKVPIKHLASRHKRLLPGTMVKLNTENGYVDASVIKAGKFMVELDLNHPFAGKTLIFDIEITAIRDASAEELAHGHAHGDGGHHH